MKLERATIHGGFLLTGVVTTMLGPLLPRISARWSLSDAQAGQFFAAQFLAALAGSLAAGRIRASLGSRYTLATGVALMAVGSAAVGWAAVNALDRAAALAAVACYGAGVGLVVPIANLLVAARNPERRAAALNILNLIWCLGAVAAPSLIALLPAGAPVVFLASLAALLATTALLLTLSASQSLQPARATNEEPPRQPAATHRVWLTAAMLFLYAGVETSLAGWLPSYGLRTHGIGEMQRALAQTTFWAAILMGRLAAPFTLDRLGAHTLIVVGLGASSAAMLLLLAAANPATLLAGAMLAGAGLAAVFPTMVAMFTARPGAVTARSTAVVFGAAALGGAAIPWLVGIASAQFGGLRAGLTVPLLCALAMLAIQSRVGSRLGIH